MQLRFVGKVWPVDVTQSMGASPSLPPDEKDKEGKCKDGADDRSGCDAAYGPSAEVPL